MAVCGPCKQQGRETWRETSMPCNRCGKMSKGMLQVEPRRINLFRVQLSTCASIQPTGPGPPNRIGRGKVPYPDRFMGFASVTLQDPKLAVEQLEQAVKKLDMKGPAVGASCAGDEFSDAKFHPFWAKCEEFGVLTSSIRRARRNI